MKHIIYALFICFLSVAGTAHAEGRAISELVAKSAPECPFVQTSNISVNFNSTESDLSKLPSILSDKIEQINALAKEKEMTKISLQSSNYSINANTGGNCNSLTGQFQFYGSASFVVEPADRAAEFLATLLEKGFTANLNVNSYRQCN